MSEITVEWIALILFFLLLVGAVIAEVQWLIRKGWATSGRSIAYVMVTDLLSLGVGSLVVFVIFGIMLMMTFGPSGTGGSENEIAMWIALIIALVFPPLLLVTLKRLFLLIFKIKSGKPAWIYSLVSSVLIILTVLIPPPLAYYLLGYSSIWKL